MMITDVFVMAEVSMIYSMNDGFMTYNFTDVITGLPILLDPQLHNEVTNNIRSYAQKSNKFPITVCFKGIFVRNSEGIFPTYLNSITILNLKVSLCYAVISNNKDVVFYDDKYDIPIEITNISDDVLNKYINYFATVLSVPETDFSKRGYHRFMVVGKLEKFGDTMVYRYDSSFLMDVTSNILEAVYTLTEP